MHRTIVGILALAWASTLGAPAAAAVSGPLTPMNAGFHEYLKCNQGYVTVDVAPADPKIAPGSMVVTTAVAVAQNLAKTRTVRSMDARGNIYETGYMLDGPAFKKFPKVLLLPAAPPSPGQHGSYYNISGTKVDKRYDGPVKTADARGRALPGYAFSDYLGSRRLNTVVYAPGTGLTEATFYGILGGTDLSCKLHG